MSSEWIKTKIGNLFTSTIPGEWGKNPETSEGVPVLRSTNFRKNGTLDYSDIVYRDITGSRLEKRHVCVGNILIEKSGGGPGQPAGRIAYCDRDLLGTASNFIEIMRVGEDHNSRYVAYLLHYLYTTGLVQKYQQQTTGIINFKLREYESEVISIPASKPEQSLIASILSTVDKAIEQTEAIIAKQERIKKGLMQDLLTKGIDEHGNIRSEATHKFKDSPLGRIPEEWEVVPITNLSVDGVQNGFFKKPELVGSGIKLINVSELYQPFGIDITLPSVERVHVTTQNLSKFGVAKGDIFFTRSSLVLSGIAKCNLVRHVPEPAVFECHVMRLRPNLEKIVPEYLALACGMPVARKYLMASAKHVTMTTISQPEVAALPVAYPPLEEQIRISDAVLHCESLISDLNVCLQKYNRLRTGLMQDLLSGNVPVTHLLKQTDSTIVENLACPA